MELVNTEELVNLGGLVGSVEDLQPVDAVDTREVVDPVESVNFGEVVELA